MGYQNRHRNLPGDDADLTASAIHWGTPSSCASNQRHQSPSGTKAALLRGAWRRAEDRHLMRLVGVLVFFMLLALSPVAFAQLDFELPQSHASGRGFVRLSSLAPKATVINFWRSDCPPCLRELPLLNRYAAEHPDLRIITIALQKPFETSSSPVLPEHPVMALHGPNAPQGLLARFGNRTGALPFSVMLDPQRQACAQKTGEIDSLWLQKHQACGADTTE